MVKYYISRIRRFLRPLKAHKLIGTSTYFLEHPEKLHPEYYKKIIYEIYLVPSSVMTWANLAILVDRDVYLNTIIKKAEQTNQKNILMVLKILKLN